MSGRIKYLKDGTPVVLKHLAGPEERGLEAFERLVSASNSRDNTNYTFDRFADGYVFIADTGESGLLAAAALYHMGDTFEGRKAEEIFAVTDPRFRNRGCFGLILDCLRKLYPDSAFKFGVYANADALKALNGIGAVHSHDELLLTISLTEGAECAAKDFESVSCRKYTGGNDPVRSKNAAAKEFAVDFGDGKAENAHSRCCFTISGETASIYSVFTWLNHRREGYAYALLSRLLKELSLKGVKRAVLQVSSENYPALSLYSKLGFKEKERLSLYFWVNAGV